MVARNARSGAEMCARITRTHARTFATASQFLPAVKRRAAFAVYAFCRVADDYADGAIVDATAAAAALDAHERELTATVNGAPMSAPFRELGWAMQHYSIPPEPFYALIAMLRNDLAPFEFQTWPELEAYCAGVASTVGIMCAHIFGLPANARARAEALHDACVLGVALQLTNILRDIGEDAARNRCYLPSEDLAHFGIDRAEVLHGTICATDDRWRALMRFEIGRTRELYLQAERGLVALNRDAQCCARICAWGYAAILNAIELRELDSLTGRSRVGTTQKLRIMLRAWGTTRFGASARRDQPRGLVSERELRT